MTEGDVATRYFALTQGMARARTAGSLAYLRDEVESAAMGGLMEAARSAVRDNTPDPERYVRRTVKLRITDALRRHGPQTRRGHRRHRVEHESDLEGFRARGGTGDYLNEYAQATTSLVPATRPYDEDARQSARVSLAAGAQRAISRGAGGGKMAHLMRWLLVVAMLAPGAALADATVTWPTKDEGGLTIPTKRSPVPGAKCDDNTLRKCWSAEIINGAAGNLVVDDDPFPGETHHWRPCFRAGVGYVLAVCWNDCGQGLASKVATNCVGPAQPVAPGVKWP